MPYVMVPVPEEHVPEILRHVLRLVEDEADGEEEQGSTLRSWDPESMRDLFSESDELTRSVLSFLAQPGNTGGVRPPQVAQALELQGRNLSTLLKTLKARAEEEYGRASPVRNRKVSVGEAGSRRIRFLVMDEEVAELVREAERAVHRAEIGEGEA